MSDERAFRGVWIPADIWLNRELSLQEKVMLIEIDSLQHPQKGCFKSNKKLAEFFGLSTSRVSRVISKLEDDGWVRVDHIRDGKQIIERRIFMVRSLGTSERSAKTQQGYCENASNPSAETQEGCCENASNPSAKEQEGYCGNDTERGSGLGVQLEGTSKSVAPGASPAASEGDYLSADEPEPTTSNKAESSADLLARIPADMPGTRDPSAKTFKAWANYAIAYRNRYKTWPVSNQKTSAMLSQLVDRVGAELAPKVAAFYLQMNQQFYLTKLHPVSLLLAECEAIATQCTTGRQMTHAQARQVDSTQSNLSNLEQAKAMLRERNAQREGTTCH